MGRHADGCELNHECTCDERLRARIAEMGKLVEALRSRVAEVHRTACRGDGLQEYIARQAAWSSKTFGPGKRTEGILQHIALELEEVRAAPTDLTEWVDVIILALDGAWRAGFSPREIVNALEEKYRVNAARNWPLFGTEDQPIEHVRRSDGR